jgi:hypothetical protein
MAALLALDAEPYDQQEPVVCFDATLDQRVREVRQPLPPAPGRPQRYAAAYGREGTCNLFLCFQPLPGWRHGQVTARRTAPDVAQCLKALVDEYLPHARRSSVVLDNRHPHTPAALYAA